MKIAIFSDIHGNLVALQSILQGIGDADRVICLGDVAASGPQPHEIILFLRRAGWPCVLGNTDETLAKKGREDFSNLKIPTDERQKLAALHDWTASKIDATDRKYLAGFKPTVEINGGRHSLLCYHGSPRSNIEQVLPTASAEELGKIFEGKHAQAYAGGHTHSQMVRKFGTSLIINPGSVGLPFYEAADGRVMNPVWAEYAVLTTSGDDLRVELRRERYSKHDLKAAVTRSGMPDPEWWLRDWI
ncbi:MAG TPA: metallophosphoesterase family protein [Nitrososphaerales archaeon]|nr:metallophosphoesterase family protein [Nitrososphaerales archaeon]